LRRLCQEKIAFAALRAKRRRAAAKPQRCLPGTPAPAGGWLRAAARDRHLAAGCLPSTLPCYYYLPRMGLPSLPTCGLPACTASHLPHHTCMTLQRCLLPYFALTFPTLLHACYLRMLLASCALPTPSSCRRRHSTGTPATFAHTAPPFAFERTRVPLYAHSPYNHLPLYGADAASNTITLLTGLYTALLPTLYTGQHALQRYTRRTHVLLPLTPACLTRAALRFAGRRRRRRRKKKKAKKNHRISYMLHEPSRCAAPGRFAYLHHCHMRLPI